MRSNRIIFVRCLVLFLSLANVQRSLSQNVFPASGNVGIGTSTPSVLLQVNGTMSANGFNLYGTGFQADGNNFQFGNGILFDKTAGTSRIFSGGQLIYQSNYPGNQHYFNNAIGTTFTGNLVTIDPGGYALQTNQLSLNVLGKQSTLGLCVNMLGYVGIGTITPSQKLEVSGTIKTSGLLIPTGAAAGMVLTSDAAGNATWQSGTGGSAGSTWGYNGNSVSAITSIGNISNFDLPIITNNIERMRIGANGSVGIGTISINDANYKLFVETGIKTRKIKVDQAVWADYVFSGHYRLMSIDELRRFISAHKHLPDVLTEEEVKNTGVDLGENQVLLLKKIEELTLYLIQEHKEIEKLKIAQKRLEARNKMLEKRQTAVAKARH